MSDSAPLKPKPGSLRDRIAAFEQKPASSPAPPAPRPKPGGLSQWKKPPASSPPDSPQSNNRNDHSMSATDAKESITKGGSLKERMAALQGLGAFGGGPAASPPPKPSEKPKWKPPPQVAVAPPVTGDDEEDASASEVPDTGSKPAISHLKTPNEEALSKSPLLVNEEGSVTVSDVPGGGEEEADPEEEERQRRAAIAARMARLGGTRVGMGAPIFGLKPEVKPKPVALAAEKAKEEPSIADTPVGEHVLKAENDAEPGQVEAETAENAALPTSNPTSPQAQSTSPEYVSQQNTPAVSPNIPPRAMPLLQGPRRAAPPRKKISPKPTLPAEAEVAPESLGEDTPGVTSEGLPLPIPVSSHEVVAADPIADASLAEPASGRATEESFSGPAPIVLSPEEISEPSPPPAQLPLDASDARPESPEESPIDSSTKLDSLRPDDPIELDIPSEPHVPRDESESEEATAHEPSREGVSVIEEEKGNETTRQHVSEMGGFNPIGGQPATLSLDETTTLHAARKLSVDTLPEGTGDSTLESQPLQPGAPFVSHLVYQQGGSANAENDEDGGDNESDPHAQALLQHAVEHESLKTVEGAIDYDEDARVAHEVEVKEFTRVAEPGQPPEDRYDEAEGHATAEATPSPIHSRSATAESEAAQVGTEDEPFTPNTPPAEDVSDSEMAPPRVTRPLPPAPNPPAPGVNTESTIARAPVVPKRISMPPPTRAVPVLDYSPPLALGSSPQRTPSKRASVPPPSREMSVPFQESPDASSSRRQSPTQRSSIATPSRVALSPHSELLVPPPPPPPTFGVIDQGRVLTREPEVLPQVQDVPIPPPPPVLTPKPSIPPLTPEGRKSAESRRSADSRHSREERRSSGQYPSPGVPVPAPLKKRAPTSLVPEQGVLHEDIIDDPIDPRLHTPSKSPVPYAPHSGAEPPTSAAALQSGDEPEDDGLKRRRTIAERMAKLGGIKFGAPPPMPRVQPSTSAAPTEEVGTDGGVQNSGQSAPEESGEPSEEAEAEDEQARRQRIAAKIAGMGGMRFGMLPIQPAIGVATSPPPPPPTLTPARREEDTTPRGLPRTIPAPPEPPSESDYEYDHPSSSDDGVRVEAEESEPEEVYHVDLEDEYGVEDAEEEEEEPLALAPPPPPPPPRSTRPPIPSARPPPIPSTPPPRSGSVDTLTSIPRPPVRQATSDFVMVDPEDAQPAPSVRRGGGGPPPRSAPPPAPESSDLAASTGQWELPSIPTGSLDFGDTGATSDLSASAWSEDSTAYPPRSSVPPPAPPAAMPPPRRSAEQSPRALVDVPARMTVDELRVLWERVGTHVAKAAGALLERSKHKLVGNGSYEGFVAEALAEVPNALAARGPGEYGFLVYAQTAAQVHTRLADIMPGDVVVLEGARLKGHKGLHTYSMSVGESAPCMGVVSEFDPKKLKLRALQANKRVGQATVESVSYRLDDLKSGTIKVYRVLEA